ncbi:MAG: GTP cyclohydrolase FolE2 [Pseudomonadota bacterium]
MTIHTPDLSARTPTQEDAAAALDTLRAWASAQPAEAVHADLDPDLALLLDGYPSFARDYDAGFSVDAAYRATLPDLQNGPESLIRGKRARIQHVGISNFRLPLRLARPDGTELTAEASVTGTVSLEADKKGINMSRIMRSFYAEAAGRGGLDVADAVLDGYKRDLGSFDARLMLRFSYPMEVPSLRSGLSGWQYYDVALEVAEAAGVRTRILHVDYVYSSTCPCSLELSEHARRTRGQLATPHSQRSVARLSVVLKPGAALSVEDVVAAARAAVPTETQVMVKREDEQAFAELNAANPIFVEDAARLFAGALTTLPGVGDIRVAASHQESLHSHDAVSVLSEGETFAGVGALEPHLFASLVHRG